VIKALMRASERGKQVAALVELKARFDEENNIEWARKLEKEGVHVVYGLRGLKTHCKLALVVRREGDQLRRYVHLATGNYNPTTSRIYTDVGILTADEEIGADASDLFNFLTGYSKQTEYRDLMVAPVNLRRKMIGLIRREAENARLGNPAHIIAKVNSLTDVDTVRELYLASQAGVKIDLLVRGICVLRPGIDGLSENIRVTSVVGRFLEHSRIFYFHNGGEDEVFIGSADLMQRNLDRRVEVIAPVKSPELRKYLRNVVLETYFRDNVNAQILLPDGEYQRLFPSDPESVLDSQLAFVGQEI
jgi:polyphosphate kinase